MSQDELAVRLGMRREYLSKLENDRHEPHRWRDGLARELGGDPTDYARPPAADGTEFEGRLDAVEGRLARVEAVAARLERLLSDQELLRGL